MFSNFRWRHILKFDLREWRNIEYETKHWELTHTYETIVYYILMQVAGVAQSV
jgi:hypothetical protein